MTDCEHWDGDMVQGYWLCAKCYAKLPHRPHRLVSRRGSLRNEDGGHPHVQDIVNAPIATAQGYTLSKFIDAMANRLIARTGGAFERSDAIDYAIDILRGLGDPFGTEDLDWTRAGAWEIVDEDMQNWDAASPASN